MLTRRAAASAAAALCLTGVTALTPAAYAAPGVPAAATLAGRPAAPGGGRLGPAAEAQLVRDLRAAWQITRGDGVTVAIVGGGVDPATPGLAGKVTAGPMFGPAGHDSRLPDSLMAAAVAGEGPSAATPYGTVGMAPGARVLSLPVKWNARDGVWQVYEARAIRYAVKHKAEVIYLDSVGPGDLPVLDSAVQAALARDVVVIPTGYRWRGLTSRTAMFPNSLPGVLTASAVTLAGLPPPCPGRYIPPAPGSFLVVAPAAGVGATSPGGSPYTLCYSVAADVWLVSTAVLIKSVFPKLPPSLVARAIAMSARDRPHGGFSAAAGFGMLNPVGALRAAAALQHLPAAARPGPGAVDPAARLTAGPAPPAISAVRHPPVLLGACGGSVAAGAVLLAAAAAAARRRRQARVRIS